ncbi:MAG: D-3-phosphoglycerate dehydrogenase, partial [Gammaproteobacteria bacterium]
SMSSQAAAIFEDRGVEVVQSSKLSEAELFEMIGEFEGLAIRSSTQVTEELLKHATKLKVVGRAGIGVDNVDVAACTRRGVIVMNTPLGNAITTAEHAMAMMLSLARHIPQANSSTRQGKWEKTKFMGMELTGKMLGLIGAGNIGSIVAAKALGYGLRVQAYDPFLTEERADKLGVSKVTLDELLANSDIISLHVPKTPETTNIISASAMNKMKAGSLLINCARGGLVDELALYAALSSGHIKGAALDVFEVEPARENPLFELDNVICTPHLGASTIEAQEKVALQVAEQISDYLTTGAVNNAINAPSISAEESRLLKPYLYLSKCLGSFVGQLTHDPIKSVTITYGGEANKLNVNPLSNQVIQSILEHHSSSINSVNAREVARERNIDIIEAHNEGRDEYPCRITVTVETESKIRGISGTLIQNRPRVIDVKGIPLESKLGEHMLYITNLDTPGVIGHIGTTAAERGINIANMHLGRDNDKGEAMVLLEIDEQISGEDLVLLRGLPNIHDAQYLHFPAY